MYQPLPIFGDSRPAPSPAHEGRRSRAAAGFRCIGPDCEDTCCGGMGVVIDRATYEKYRTCPDPALKDVMDRVIVPDPQSVHDATFARIAPTRFCSFLTDERLCAIQQRLGDGYLSRTCATYPRALNLIDGILERSLYLSCPEAARLVLLDPDAMLWEAAGMDPSPAAVPTLSTSGDALGGKPYPHFHTVRAFIVSLLRDRTYALWERLTIVGMLCSQLDGPTDAWEGQDGDEALASFRECVTTGQFRPTLAGVSALPAPQVDFLVQAFDHRLRTDAAPRFVDSYWEFREGIGYTPEATPAQAAERYAAARDQYFAPFLGRHPHILENYVLAYVERSLFPFGPQTSLYHGARSCSEEFARVAIHYALVRSLLIGMAGYHKSAFGPIHVVRGVQAFAKSVEHDLPYQEALLASLIDAGLAHLPFLAVLMRD